jgi:hypothetical protein
MELSKSLIAKLRKKLPDLCSVSDLLRVGIYRSEQAAYAARKSGKCPANFRLAFRGIVYPREEVIDYLKKAASGLKKETEIKDAIISHSEVPPVTQKRKDIRR